MAVTIFKDKDCTGKSQTISGKITELAVREVIHGRPVTNTEALANPGALDLFRGLPELSV